MHRALLATIICLTVLWVVPAAAENRSIGVGVLVMPQHTLNIDAPTAAMGVQFDMTAFTVDVMLIAANADGQGSAVGVAGRFYFIAHHGNSADFGVGGGLATVVVDPPRGDSQVGLLYEGGVRIRAFIVPSVALTVSAGMSGALYDGNSSVGIGGRPTGSAGILYFF